MIDKPCSDTNDRLHRYEVKRNKKAWFIDDVYYSDSTIAVHMIRIEITQPKQI